MEEHKDFWFQKVVKVYVNACIMPRGEGSYDTICIEVINFRKQEVLVEGVEYDGLPLLPEKNFYGRDIKMPHIIPGYDRWFIYLNAKTVENFDPENLGVVCVTTKNGSKFRSEKITYGV